MEVIIDLFDKSTRSKFIHEFPKEWQRLNLKYQINLQILVGDIDDRHITPSKLLQSYIWFSTILSKNIYVN